MRHVETEASEIACMYACTEGETKFSEGNAFGGLENFETQDLFDF